MMDHSNGWMGGGMWLWTVIGVLGVVTLIFMMGKLFRKEQYVYDPPVK